MTGEEGVIGRGDSAARTMATESIVVVVIRAGRSDFLVESPARVVDQHMTLNAAQPHERRTNITPSNMSSLQKSRFLYTEAKA
jgi:hypothetical protein